MKYLYPLSIALLLSLLVSCVGEKSAETPDQQIVGHWVVDSVSANMDTTKINSQTVGEAMAIMHKTHFSFMQDHQMTLTNPKRTQKGSWKLDVPNRAIITRWSDDTTRYNMAYDSLSENCFIVSTYLPFGSFTTYYSKADEK